MYIITYACDRIHGQGEKVERLYRDVGAYAIPGGSEEIMLDFGVRDSMKPFSRL